MKVTNSVDRYGFVSIFLHWVMALIIIAMIAVGLYMADLPVSPLKLTLYRWHKEFGVLILLLVAIRLGWRILNVKPSLLSLPLWERFSARLVHWIFYGIMFVLPVTGLILSSAAGISVSFFGLFLVPDLVSPNEHLRHLFTEIHEWIAYYLIAVICLHTAAALKHHFINKDNILRRILWS